MLIFRFEFRFIFSLSFGLHFISFFLSFLNLDYFFLFKFICVRLTDDSALFSYVSHFALNLCDANGVLFPCFFERTNRVGYRMVFGRLKPCSSAQNKLKKKNTFHILLLLLLCST